MSINVIQGRGEQHSMYYIPPRVSIIKNQYVIWERGPTMVSTIVIWERGPTMVSTIVIWEPRTRKRRVFKSIIKASRPSVLIVDPKKGGVQTNLVEPSLDPPLQ